MFHSGPQSCNNNKQQQCRCRGKAVIEKQVFENKHNKIIYEIKLYKSYIANVSKVIDLKLPNQLIELKIKFIKGHNSFESGSFLGQLW